MAIEEHPGWKEFPLEIGQPVRSDQINALWWALSERASVVGFTPIESNFGIFDSETGDFVRYRGDSRLCLVKPAGQSELRAFEHLNAIRSNVAIILTLFINPEIQVVTGEEAEADEDLIEGNVKDPPFINWTLSDILKFLELGGPQAGFSSSDPDAIFTFTRIPDRENQVIGKDENGNDVKFNDFFGEPEYAGVQAGDPTFKEHLNELYFVIKELKFINFGPSGVFPEFRSSQGQLIGDEFDAPDEFDEFLESWPLDLADVAFNTAFGTAAQGILASSGSGWAARGSSNRFGGPGPIGNKIQGTYEYIMSSQAELSEIPFPIFPNQPKKFGENNDLPSPYVYGEVHAFVRVFQSHFLKVVTTLPDGEEVVLASGSEPSFENPILKAVSPDDFVEGTGFNMGIIDLQQGEEVLSFDITIGVNSEISEEEFIKEIDVTSVNHLLPVADLQVSFDVASPEEISQALQLWFAGSLSDYGGNPSNLNPPSEEFFPSLVASFTVNRHFQHLPVIGFFEIISWVHVDRIRDPLAPCFPSCQTV